MSNFNNVGAFVAGDAARAAYGSIKVTFRIDHLRIEFLINSGLVIIYVAIRFNLSFDIHQLNAQFLRDSTQVLNEPCS